MPQEQDFPHANHLCLQALEGAVQLLVVQLEAVGPRVGLPVEEQQLGRALLRAYL